MGFQEYCEYLERLPLSRHTVRNYKLRVRKFLDWLESSADGETALTNPTDRDLAIRDYRVCLLQSGAMPSTVNAVLASLDNFFLFCGLGAAKVRRQELPAAAPKSLEADELRRVIKTVAHCSTRNKTIALLLLHTGLRISELAALNVGDVFVTARKGELIVRCGKNIKHRKIPLNSDLREAMQAYLSSPRNPAEPLFNSQKGNRMSISAIDSVVRQIAADAGVEMSAHTLRHVAIGRLVRAGVDIVIVAEIAGHSRLETTRRYSLPSASSKAEAMEKLSYGQV